LLLLLYLDGGSDAELKASETYARLADTFGLDEQERVRTRRFKDGRYEPEWHNRVQWSRNELRKSGLLDKSERGSWRLSPSGHHEARVRARQHLLAPTTSQADLPGFVSLLRDADRSSASLPDVEDLNISVREGGKKLVTHLRRERNPTIVRKKKEHALRTARGLQCEACDFDFRAVYGDRGLEFCEAHHTRPLSDENREVETTLDDLAIVCSNCHRMLHRPPFISVAKLRDEVMHRRKAGPRDAAGDVRPGIGPG
jgi:hypothetical protein